MQISEIENLIPLYNSGKITSYILEKELTLAISSGTNRSVRIAEKEGVPGSSIFGIVSVPIKKENSLAITYVIDKGILLLLSPHTVITALLNEVKHSQSSLRALSDLINRKSGVEIDLHDALALYLKLYKFSLTSFLACEGLEDNIKASLPSMEKVDACIKDAEDGRIKITELIENITIENIIPKIVIDTAKSLSETSKVDTPEHPGPETPTDYLEYKAMQDITDGSYGKIKSRTIKYDYYPDTNQ